MKIAVDAMGGDHAPRVVVQGALQALNEWGIDILLLGDKEAVEKELGASARRDRFEIRHCSETILMDDPPLKSLRQKKDSSIAVAFEMAKRGEVDAVVSAGNSGALLAAAMLTLGRVRGVERPAFAGIFPGDHGDVVLVDVGANVDCRPSQLFQFGVMAHAFATSCLGMANPKVGLLSIGEEVGKGNEQVRLAYDLFKASRLNFVGNVEGRDILSGKVQIVVCDGFVGNVVLKLSEGITQMIIRRLREGLNGSLHGKTSLLLGRTVFTRLRDMWDYAEYGGAPILGVKGVGIVCHGGSSAKAIKNAIRVAESYARKDIQGLLETSISQFEAESV